MTPSKPLSSNFQSNLQGFKQAIAATGLIPPDDITPGAIIRFPGLNKPPKNKDAWCLLFEDGVGGVFGDYSSSIHSVWQADRSQKYSASEQKAFNDRVRAARCHFSA